MSTHINMTRRSVRRGREFKKPTDMRRRYHEDSLAGLSYPKLRRLGRVTTVVSHKGVVRVNLVVLTPTSEGIRALPRTVKL